MSKFLRLFMIVLACSPALSTTRFTAMDIAVNLFSLVAMYLLAANEKPARLAIITMAVWAILFAQVFAMDGLYYKDVTIKAGLLDAAMSVLPVVSGGVVLIAVFALSRLIKPSILNRIGGRRVLVIVPSGLTFLTLYFII